MHAYQRDFIELALKHQALCFGEFTLKSGRISPYFFNAGKFQTGGALAELGRHYAAALAASGVEFDMVFGPAYKGIPLAAALSITLADDYDQDLPWCYNRKEAKAHGEGGTLVGAPLEGRVLIVDDVITAGTAVREVMATIKGHRAQPAAVLIGLNRQERGQGELSAIQEVEQEFAIPVVSIIQLDDIVTYLEGETGQGDMLARMMAYRDQYGVSV